LFDGDFPYLAAEMDGALVGYAYAGAYRARPAYRFSVENSVYVASEMQGRGIGRTLLEALIVAAEGRGFRQMIAVIGDSANAPSVGLHRALGFRMIGTIESVGFKFDRWLDTVLMQRALGPEAKTTPSG
jgi:phosphinothricin acetyltransferase